MVTELKNFSVGLTLLMEFSYTSVKHQTGVKKQVIKLGLVEAIMDLLGHRSHTQQLYKLLRKDKNIP